MAKFIFVTGGVVSGLGKGITASSLGMLLTLRGFRVTIQKLDPYINVDPGTMSPYEHGEVFVTNDGAETDLDIGHYERFLGRNLTANSSFSSGQIWLNVINKERKGEYLGKTIQIVPHITNEIIDTMKSVANDVDIVIVEIGGTVGEIESSTFIEAIRQFRNELGDQDSLSVHVTLVPFLEMSGEIKTKPTQISVRELGSMGVFTDIIVCRSSANVQLDTEARKKIALFCNLGSHENVIHNYDSRSIYEVPLTLKEQNFDDIVLKKLGLCAPQPDLKDWRNMVKHMFNGYPKKTVAIVGKYVSVPDAYLSVVESVNIAGISCKIKPEIKLVDSEEIEKHGAAKCLKGVDAIIVPGGFGNRGIEGKIKTAEYARKNNIPYLGICLGMQIAVIEFARNVAGIKGATSSEFDPTAANPVIDIMEEQKQVSTKGATMRLGLYDCKIKSGTKVAKLYGKTDIKERHRHRFEFNNKYREQLEKAGLKIVGVNEDADLVEIIELPNHKYYVASQFHPEFLSKPNKPHPLFVGLMNAIRN